MLMIDFGCNIWASSVNEVPYLERVLVDKVQRVSRELGTTTGIAADQIGILVACCQLSTAGGLKTVAREDKRVICQIKSLETLERSVAIVTVWTRGKVGITVLYVRVCVCVSNCSSIGDSLSGLFWV